MEDSKIKLVSALLNALRAVVFVVFVFTSGLMSGVVLGDYVLDRPAVSIPMLEVE